MPIQPVWLSLEETISSLSAQAGLISFSCAVDCSRLRYKTTFRAIVVSDI